ncbi:MAG TPA: TOBE domain-containing protein, partial [Gemmatimonadaceae bacterium]|nr:TOBE domain-containing protein [Gemmatimonadaceae bacterium]
EAGLLGDIAILLDGGRVLQSGPPEQVFRRPASPYIAEFLGAENVFAGEVRVLRENDQSAARQGADRRNLGDTSAVDVSARTVRADTSTVDGSEFPGDGHQAIEFRTGPLAFYTVGDAHDGAGYAVIRAGEVLLSLEPQHSSARNNFRGTVTEVATTGALAHVTVDVSGVPIVAALTTRSAEELSLVSGAAVWVSFKAMAVHLC